ncbi:MAG TPA: diaminobutyrate acetyltransferase [Gammaproteobacteria bacterium]
MTGNIEKSEVFLRPASTRDGARMWMFVKEHGVLELNSAYCYLLMATHFGRHCLIAETAADADPGDADSMAGFVLAYRPPEKTEELFVWQIGVHPGMRGRGLAKRMLHELLALPANRGVQYIAASVATGNEPSRALFRGFANDANVDCEESAFFSADLFPAGHGKAHEAEDLFRVGPLDSAGATRHV